MIDTLLHSTFKEICVKYLKNILIESILMKTAFWKMRTGLTRVVLTKSFYVFFLIELIHEHSNSHSSQSAVTGVYRLTVTM